MRRAPILLIAATSAHASAALAQPDPVANCVSAHDGAQDDRQQGKLGGCTRQAGACAPPMPARALFASSAAKLLSEVEKSLPSVVFVVKDGDGDGDELSDVSVFADGKKVTERLTGTAVALDPGPRVFRFERAGATPMEKSVVVREGEKLQRVEIAFPSTKPSPAKSGVDPGRHKDAKPPKEDRGSAGIPAASYAFGGLALVALGGFTYFALSGRNKENDLRDSCAPNCKSGSSDDMYRDYIVADIALGVAAVSTGLAIYFLIDSSQASSSAAGGLAYGRTATGGPHGARYQPRRRVLALIALDQSPVPGGLLLPPWIL